VITDRQVGQQVESSPPPDPAAELVELVPLLRRAVAVDAKSLVRIRVRADSASAFILLPFAVLAGRRIAGEFASQLDGAFGSAELLEWLDHDPKSAKPGLALMPMQTPVPMPMPASQDAQWRSALPPERGWRRVETVPDDVIRTLVRAGARTLRQAAEREGVPGGQARAEVGEVLLDTVVLTAESDTDHVMINLRLVSALTRMGFMARDSHIAIDVGGRWVRVAAAYGSVYAERPGLGLGLIATARSDAR
jgi:hypothetical protein